MRIAIISYDFDPPIGGLGVHVQRVLAALQSRKEGDEYIVLSPSPACIHRNLFPFAARRWNKRGGSPVFSFALLFGLRRFIRARGIDLVHAHAGSGGVFLLRKPEVPLVLTVHHTYHDEASAYRGWQRWRKLVMTVPERRTYLRADRIMCVSSDMRDMLMRSYRIPGEKIIVVENAVDAQFFLPDGERDGKHLLFVGRIEPRKGVDVLLRAFAILVKEYPDLRMTIAGSNHMGDRFTAMLDRIEGKERIHVRGHIDREEHLKLLHTAGILVVPSVREGFGLVAAEGMAAGIPVVASDCTGLRSVVTHGVTGMLFPTGDAHACADALRNVIQDDALRRELSTKGRREAAKRFTTERQARETERIYRTVRDAA